MRSNGHPSSKPWMLCSALVVTYLSETKMDVSVRLLKHAFSPGRHSSGGNRFLAEIDRTEKRKQHPHLGPASRTWLLALSWVFLLSFFNCRLLLFTHSSIFSSQAAMAEIFNYLQYHPPPPPFQTIAWLNGCSAACIRLFLPRRPQKHRGLSQRVFVAVVGRLVC